MIAEASFQHQIWEPEIKKLMKYGDLLIVICEANAEVSAKRHLERGMNEPKREFYHGDKRVSHFRKTGVFLPAGDYKPPSIDVPTIRVSTLDGYSPELDEVRKQITSLLGMRE